MIIGIEARSATHPQVGGYKTYVTNLIRALLSVPSHHEYRLFTDRDLCPSEWPPDSVALTDPVSNPIPIVRQVVREQIQLVRAARRGRCQILHLTANTGPLRTDIPTILTLHDVIALSSPQAAFSLYRARLWPWLISRYEAHVLPAVAERAAAIITVSRFEKERIIETLGVDSTKVFVTHLGAADLFVPLVGNDRLSVQARVRDRFGVDHGYFLTVGWEPRKNVRRVIQAYSRLAPAIRFRRLLVIVCAKREVKSQYQGLADSLGIGEQIRVVGPVSQMELAGLYNCAVALVFPSLRESFGLPVLEAMACGTPVITANMSSLPEVAGRAALLANPEDVPEIADRMTAVAQEPELRDHLRSAGLRQSSRFSWEKTAEETLNVYETVARSI